MSGRDEVPPLVLLGLDAGDPELLERWAVEGRLPTLSRLMQRGLWAATGGRELICEHGTWVSLLSGVSRARHGYYYYRQLVPGTYDLRTISGRDVDVRPFWASLRGTGRAVAVIDAPDIEPVPGLEGLQLAHWAVHNPPGPPAAEPPGLLDEVERLVGPRTLIAERLGTTPGEDLALLERLLERARRKGELCRKLLAGRRWALVVAVFGETHTGSHQFWRYRPGAAAGPDPAAEPALRDGIRELYVETDRQVGLLLESLPADANVVVVSSTGMKPQYPTGGLMESFCRCLGYQASPVQGAPSLRPLDVARRLLPERWRLALSRRLSRAARERLLADAFRASTDWSRTRAFAVPSSYTGFVRVNLRGREPLGTVEPGPEYDELLAGMRAELARVVDPVTGRPAVRDVSRTDALFGGAPPRSLPDLFVEWQPAEHFIPRAVHPSVDLAQARPEFFRDSDHSRQGFLIAAGPSVAPRGRVPEVAVPDLAPTFLSLLGETPVGKELPGNVLRELLRV